MELFAQFGPFRAFRQLADVAHPLFQAIGLALGSTVRTPRIGFAALFAEVAED